MYVTDESHIVSHAKYCYREYPTIVNNIPKEKNKYRNTYKDFALVDNKLAASQRAIGESSNLAQVALSYSYTNDSQVMENYVCILSVLAQCAIDNGKRTFDIDIPNEIKRIKKEMNVKENGYPAFWLVIRRGFSRSKINPSIHCPMNKIYNIKGDYYRPSTSTIPVRDFLVKSRRDIPTYKSRKIEGLIEKYSLQLQNYHINQTTNAEDFFLMREDFEEMVRDIRQIDISNKYQGLFYWFIKEAFRCRSVWEDRYAFKNRSLLLKTLYTVNKEAFMSCFTINPVNTGDI